MTLIVCSAAGKGIKKRLRIPKRNERFSTASPCIRTSRNSLPLTREVAQHSCDGGRESKKLLVLISCSVKTALHLSAIGGVHSVFSFKPARGGQGSFSPSRLQCLPVHLLHKQRAQRTSLLYVLKLASLTRSFATLRIGSGGAVRRRKESHRVSAQTFIIVGNRKVFLFCLSSAYLPPIHSKQCNIGSKDVIIE